MRDVPQRLHSSKTRKREKWVVLPAKQIGAEMTDCFILKGPEYVDYFMDSL